MCDLRRVALSNRPVDSVRIWLDRWTAATYYLTAASPNKFDVRTASVGRFNSLALGVKNAELFSVICGILVVVASQQNVYSEVHPDSSRLPAVNSASEAVKKVFDVDEIRPFDDVSFQSLRPYFSDRQCKRIDEFLSLLSQVTEKRNRLANEMGTKQDWWWPGDLGLNIRALMQNDPLTDRSAIPDTIRISDLTMAGRKIEITVEERYNEIANDGTDLGGTKSSRITLVPQDDRWVIDKIVFTVHQYERTTVTSLTEILDTNIKQLRRAWDKMRHEKSKFGPLSRFRAMMSGTEAPRLQSLPLRPQ